MLPQDFTFSQGSLQDFVDCPRRFQLKYVMQQPWPAVEVEPALEREEHARRGQRFHRMMEQYYSGVSADLIRRTVSGDPQLSAWWQAFLAEPPLNLPQTKQIPEVTLSTVIDDHWFVGVFDLLAIDPGKRLVIVDWKTVQHRRPTYEWMQARLQTSIYPLLVTDSAAHLFEEPVDPARVSMVYWFANFPDEPHVLYYDQSEYDAARDFLRRQVAAITALDGVDVWPLTDDEKLCKFCPYRSLCGRGVEAGVVDAASLIDEGEIDWAALTLDVVDEYAY